MGISLQLSQGYCIGVAAECRWRAFSLFYLFLINSIMSFARMEDNPLPGPGPAPAGPPEEVPWWLKYGGRGLGTFGGIVAMALGVVNIISSILSPICIFAGILQVLVGFVLILAEAPCCCMFLDFGEKFANFIEKRPLWNKAALYTVMAVPPISFCQSVSVFLGCALVFATGVVYGLMSLGRKASRGEMLSRAQQDQLASTLVKNMEPTHFTPPQQVP